MPRREPLVDQLTLMLQICQLLEHTINLLIELQSDPIVLAPNPLQEEQGPF